MKTAYTGVPAAAPMYGTQDVDSLEDLFQHKGIVVKMPAIPASRGQLWVHT